jgi:3-oxoacyl-[acyl-carrier-protein] synthase-3
MEGQAVFKHAVTVLSASARTVLAKAGKTEAELDWLVPHQANIRIMLGTARKLHLPPEKMIVTVAEHGNTSAASIPLALDHGVRAGQIKPGQTLLLEAVGGGLTWGAALAVF